MGACFYFLNSRTDPGFGQECPGTSLETFKCTVQSNRMANQVVQKSNQVTPDQWSRYTDNKVTCRLLI